MATTVPTFVIFLLLLSSNLIFSSANIIGKYSRILTLYSLKSLILDVVDYWPELGNDLTKVIWSHATNSKEKLQNALDGKIKIFD